MLLLPVVGRRTVAVGLALIVLVGLGLAGHASTRDAVLVQVDPAAADQLVHQDDAQPAHSARVLQGSRLYDKDGRQVWNAPDRLLEDEHYLIAGSLGGGLTNQVISAINGIHIAITTGRVPILPAFTPHPGHLGTKEQLTYPLPDLPFSDLFDLPRTVASLQATRFGRYLQGAIDAREIMEVNAAEKLDVKNPAVMWQLHCWCAWRPTTFSLNHMHLNSTCTYLPPDTLKAPTRVSSQGLAKYLASDANRTMLAEAIQANETLPSHKVACLDSAFYMWNPAASQIPPMYPAENEAEVVTADDGSWRTVGQYMHYAPPLREKAESVLRELFEREEHEDVPPYIAVHIRHGDFLSRCKGECYSQNSYAAALNGIQAELLSRKGLNVTDVLLASDDMSPAFREEAKGRGWKMVDEEMSLRIRKKWGDWYPTLIDKVLLSHASGFVGTKGSTMSSRSAYRVQYWNDGPSVFVDRYE